MVKGGNRMKIGDFKIGDTLRCIKGDSHPNLGRMFTKRKQYKITDIVNGRIIINNRYKSLMQEEQQDQNYLLNSYILFAVGNWYVEFEYILKHFIKEENNDDSKRR